jgi:hypothetical protein
LDEESVVRWWSVNEGGAKFGYDKDGAEFGEDEGDAEFGEDRGDVSS